VGYQKVPWIASIGDEAVWTSCGSPTDLASAHELVSHASLPATAQWANVAVVAYKPASMLVRLKLGSQVFAHWPSDALAKLPNSETSVVLAEASGESKGLGWALARVDDAYLGLGCNCLRYDEGAAPAVTAAAEQCFWVCIVGTRQEFGCYDSFVALCRACTGTFDEAGGAVVLAPAELCRGNHPASIPPKTTATGERVIECRFLSEQPSDDDHGFALAPPPSSSSSSSSSSSPSSSSGSRGSGRGEASAIRRREGSDVPLDDRGAGSSEYADDYDDVGDEESLADEDADARDSHEKGLVDLVGSASVF
jgi:hypothetical protein